MELPDSVYDQITQFSEEGESLFNRGEFLKALLKYKAALALVPDPKGDWEAATWLFTAIGDSYFQLGKYAQALEAFLDARNCPDGIANPFIHLRAGECYFEQGDLANAEEFMLRAFMWAGGEIFDNEEEKYVKFMREKYDLN